MRRFAGAFVAALLAGCGNLPTTDDGVAFLEIIPPATLTLEVGATLRIVARALDRGGQPVDVPVTWRTPDATVSIDGTGLVTGLSVGPGRVQASVGDSQRLVSDFIALTVHEPAAEGGSRR